MEKFIAERSGGSPRDKEAVLDDIFRIKIYIYREREREIEKK